MQDKEIEALITAETNRQRNGLEMIPSENHTSQDVLTALGSRLTDKYSEGYPGKRYYGGCEFVDKVENLARDRAKALFGVSHANVQAYSGSPANQAIYFALADPGDTVMGLELYFGGHMTHGLKVNFSGTIYNSVQYRTGHDGVFYNLVTVCFELWCGCFTKSNRNGGSLVVVRATLQAWNNGSVNQRRQIFFGAFWLFERIRWITITQNQCAAWATKCFVGGSHNHIGNASR